MASPGSATPSWATNMSSSSSISWSASTIGVVQSGREVAHGQLGGGELLHRVGRRGIAACRGHRVRRHVTEASSREAPGQSAGIAEGEHPGRRALRRGQPSHAADDRQRDRRPGGCAPWRQRRAVTMPPV
jgi:hypothetical protein